MDIWKILGIEATKDKDELKKAYRVKLTGVNPEDDPEGFMRLREAYEEAVRLADSSEETGEDDSVMGQLLRAVEEQYRDFGRRISVEAWEELFNRDEFVSLDTSEEAFRTLLHYLMDHFYLPQRVWRYIADTFDVAGRRKELSELFPEDFIAYILNNAEFEDVICYDLFDGDEEEYDSFIEKYYHLDAAIRKRELDEQEKLLAELSELSVYHPYLEVSRLRNRIQRMNEAVDKKLSDIKEREGKEAAAGQKSITTASMFGEELAALQEQMIKLHEELPEDIVIINACGDVAMIRERYAEAKQYYDRSLKLAPDNYVVKGKQAELMYFLGEYEKSRDMYMDLLKINHYDNNVRAGMIRANQGLIDELGKKVEENPSDNKSRLEMAWSFYQSYRFDEALHTLDAFEPEQEKKCEYYNVKGRTYLCLLDYDKALGCFMIWKDEIQKIPKEDDSEDSADKKKRYEYVNFLIADCYLKTKRYAQAREYLDIALAKEHEEIILSYEAKCELEYETGRYEECLRACDTLLERDGRSYIGFNYMAKADYKLDYLKEALIACEHAIALYPYVSDPYGLEVRIYLQVRQPEAAKNVVKRYRSFGIESDYIDYSEACILEVEEKHQEIADLLGRTLKRAKPDDTDMEEFSELLMMLAFHLEKLGRQDEAMKYYKQVVSMEPEHPSAYGRMGIVLKNKGEYEEAVRMLSRQLEINPYSFYYIHRGLLNRFLQNYKSALEDFQNAVSLEPDNYFCYSRIGLIYELHREFELALENYDKAIGFSAGESAEERAPIYLFKARTLQCMNRFAESKEVYEQYLEEFGLDANAAYDYAELLQRMNLIDEATDILKRCIDTLEYDADMEACIRQLCFIYGSEGYIDRAHESFMLAVNKKPDDSRAYAEMGAVFKKHGLFDDARRMYEKAVSLDRDNKDNYYSELIEVILGKRTLFKPDIRPYIAKALIRKEDMRCPVDYIKMARLNRVTKKQTEALKIIDMGLKIKRCQGCFYGRCHEALFEKGLIYESMKDYEMARMCYREAIKICGRNAVYEERLKRIEGK